MSYNPISGCGGSISPLGWRLLRWPPAFNSPRETKAMLKSDFSEAISQAVAYINGIPALEDLGVSSVRLGVVLRVLNAAG